MNTADAIPPILGSLLAELRCQTGTVHRTLPDGATLELVCQIGVPDFLLEKISRIPFGKGIAGAAAEKNQPITLCNLQQDLGGVAKPDARKTGVAGSIAIPIHAAGSESVIGTLGAGMTEPHDFDETELQRLEDAARQIAKILENKAAD